MHFKRIEDYPNLSNYVRELYQWPGVAETVNMDRIKRHYYYSHDTINPTRIVPAGPLLDFMRPHDREFAGTGDTSPLNAVRYVRKRPSAWVALSYIAVYQQTNVLLVGIYCFTSRLPSALCTFFSGLPSIACVRFGLFPPAAIIRWE